MTDVTPETSIETCSIDGGITAMDRTDVTMAGDERPRRLVRTVPTRNKLIVTVGDEMVELFFRKAGTATQVTILAAEKVRIREVPGDENSTCIPPEILCPP